MFNCFKKYSVVFLSLYASSTDAMITKFLPETFFGYSYTKQYANQANLDKELWKAIRASKYSEQDFKQIEECLNKGANPNAKSNGETPLIFSIISFNNNLMKFFIQRGADINLKNTLGWTPLGYSIFYNQNSNIEILCDSGASLLNLNNSSPGANAFHHAVQGGSERKEIIKILMTHARFDSFDQDQKQKERKVLAALSVLSALPQDVRFHILAELTLVDDAYLNNKKLCKKLLIKGYIRPLFVHVDKQVKNLTKILDSEDGYYELTPSEWVSNFNHAFPDRHNKEILALIDKNRLQKNWDNFNVGFPDILKSDPDNPICEMYNNCTKLLESKSKKFS